MLQIAKLIVSDVGIALEIPILFVIEGIFFLRIAKNFQTCL